MKVHIVLLPKSQQEIKIYADGQVEIGDMGGQVTVLTIEEMEFIIQESKREFKVTKLTLEGSLKPEGNRPPDMIP